MSGSLRRRTLLGAALVATGCARVPTSGPVQQVGTASPSQVTRGVEVRPVPPTPDAPPDVVVAGFIDALASLEDGHGVARQYLTEAAAQTWNPAAGVSVFDGDSRTTVTAGGQIVLQAALVGTLDARGHFTAAPAGTPFRQVFAMTRVDGQWRIATPPVGMVVSQYTLLHRFRPVDAWFFSHSGTMVPERAWLATGSLTPVHAVQALLAGPSAWLAPAVTTAIPVGAKLTASSVAVAKGVATVQLDDVAALPNDQTLQVLQQLAFTLTPNVAIDSLRVVVGGQPWVAPGQDPSGVIRLDALRSPQSVPATDAGAVAAVVKGAVGSLDSSGTFRPLEGPLGTQPWKGKVSQVALREGQAAIVDGSGTRLLTRDLDGGQVVLRLTGPALGRPQVTGDGSVWVASGGDGATALHRGAKGEALRAFAIPALAGAVVRAFSVAPDQARVAVVVARGGRSELGLLRLNGDAVDGYRAVPLVVAASELDRIVDVGWSGPGELVILAAATSQGQPSVYRVSVDGSQVTAVGPAGDQVLTSLVAMPQGEGLAARVLVSNGALLRYGAAWRWAGISRDVTAIGPAN